MNIKLGSLGEQLAEKYLKEKGHLILEKNYRTKLGELDIIAKKDNTIIFLEVKTRTSDAFGAPREAVGNKKQKTIQRLSQQYILHRKLEALSFNYRFDVIEVKIVGKRYKIEHIKDAF